MSSKLWDTNPLIVALFDLPAGVQAYSSDDSQSNITESSPNERDVSDTDNASPRSGESEDYSNAVGHNHPPNNPRPLLFTSYFPTFGPRFATLPSFCNPDIATMHKKKKKGRPYNLSYAADINVAQHKVDDFLPLDSVTNLKLKIQRIRLSILSLESDLIKTRSELKRAHKCLHFATVELDGIKRAAFEADFGLFQLAQQQRQLSTSQSAPGTRLSPTHFFDADCMSARSSTCSTFSDRLHYLTPCSTFGGDESISSTRSISSYDSFYSLNEVDYTDTKAFRGRARISTEDKDKTPLKKNGKLKQIFSTDTIKDIGRESSSNCTPSTVACSQDETCADRSGDMANSELSNQRGLQDKNICRHESYIRAHDLTLSEGVDNISVVSLQTTDVSDIANALFQKGYEFAMDESDRWTPEQGTGKLLSKRATMLMNGEMDGPIGDWPNAAHGDEVLIWTSKCIHGGHGSEYPIVKARGLIPTSALKMVKLLLDSDRVKEYNKMSLGRIDEHCFTVGVERLTECPSTGILGELKIVRSKSQPPVVRKPIELRLLLHARRLVSGGDDNASNYLTIGRSIWETEQGAADANESSVTRCEMLLSVNLIRDISSYTSEEQQWCEITTITHGISPGIPISIGKRIGLAAATKYMRDIRAVFDK